MCGITGVFRPDTNPDTDELEAMSSCLVHRGPDEGGLYQSGPVGLAHRRLSIIDLDAGQQPVYNEDRSVAVIFNGEIYNHQSLRSSLSDSGHQFKTQTDTEVLVHLYEEYGPDFVDRLEGMFAFGLWDDDREQLILARDPMGIKPLLVAQEGNTIAFASEMSAVLSSEVAHGGLNRNAIGEYFAFGYIPAPKTAFTNIRKLHPGELMIVGRDGVHHSQYYRPSVTPITSDFTTAAEELREHVETAVEKRLMADVPLGAFLSGGIDSSIVVGVMSELVDDPVRTFSVGFGESRFDETWAAREVSDLHNTDHHEYHVTPDDVRELVPEVIDSFGEPFADSSVLPTYVVSRETSNDVTVALSGDGADELFSGYNKYRGEYNSKYYRAVPQPLRKRVIRPTIDRLPASRDSRSGELIRMAQKFVRGAEQDVGDRQYQWMAITTDETEKAFHDLEPTALGERRVETAQQRTRQILPEQRQDDLSVIQTSDARFALPDGILKKVDCASMLNSLEVRVPFLDTNVVEFAMGLPTNYTITRSQRKRLLKEAFSDILSDRILERKKQGFEIPVGEWFKNELSQEFTEMLRTIETDLINTDEVKTIYNEHIHGSKDHTHFLWSVYVFARWHQNMRQNGILP